MRATFSDPSPNAAPAERETAKTEMAAALAALAAPAFACDAKYEVSRNGLICDDGTLIRCHVTTRYHGTCAARNSLGGGDVEHGVAIVTTPDGTQYQGEYEWGGNARRPEVVSGLVPAQA